MAETTKLCEYPVSVSLLAMVAGSPVLDVACGRPAHRVSQGRPYCREHFYDVIDGATSEVVAVAAKLCGNVWQIEAYRELHGAVGRLKGLGWEPGD